MTANIDRIRQRWTEQKIQNNDLATVLDIRKFQNRYGVILPAAVRDYFTLLNGTRGGQLHMEDPNLVSFWHLDEIKPLREEMESYAANPSTQDLFVFADYSIWACGWAMELTRNESNVSLVYRINGREPIKIAESFNEFLTNYAKDDLSIFESPEK